MSTLNNDQFGRYTVVAYHDPSNSGKPRAKVHGRYDYDEDATAAANHIAEHDGSVVPNVISGADHPRYGAYSHSAYSGMNSMVAVYLKGESKYRE